ncbi:MAG: hypothetical protein FLDDKLPJ_02076 [Phycisphaerae bacterium]|nr:hypothetical protein [Phycisphaerae bacterium]
MNRWLWLCGWMVSAFAAAEAAGAEAVGTVMTYQGRLTDGGQPANGLHDIRATLFDALTGGNQVGGVVTKTNVSVSNGLFTTELDFGNVYGDVALFMQLQVSPAGLNQFETLTPRQRLTPTPFALKVPGIDGHSLNAADGSPVDALFVDNNGNVGIGTNAPINKLHVIGGLRWGPTPDSARCDEDASGLFLEQRGTSAATSKVRLQTSKSGDRTNYSQLNIDPNSGFSFMGLGTGNDRVGIGTANPVGRLDIQASNNSNVLFGRRTGGGLTHNLYIDSAGNGSMQLLDGSGTTRVEMANGLMYFNYGNVGIGTASPAHDLHIRNEEPVIILQDPGPSSTQSGYLGFWNGVPQETGWMGFGTPGSPHMSMVNARSGGDIQLLPGAGGVVSVPVLEITGADLAEKFPTSDAVEPGMVVAIDPANPGKLCLARGAYNRCVAGIVSGANNFPVGAVLGSAAGHEDAPAIALSGRVYVWCDAGSEAIQPGDLLTTSDTPGHAMKASDAARSHGAVIGKAMTPLGAGEKGLVLVLVNLQ